jgi:threonyl-tRNA synthetase
MKNPNNNNETLSHKRHTLAHLLGSTVLELYPDAKNAIGPSIDNGFYYDFEFKNPVTEKDIKAIEDKMKETLKSWKEFTHKEVSEKEAKEHFKNNPYKLELIDEIVKKDEKITLYTVGNFTDLCRGGHTENPNKDIEKGSWKLSHVAGAYWRGNEKNKMLTRIYGLAFDTNEDLKNYEKMREEAEKRDHKKLGRELDLFTFSPLVGQGLPLWTPKGTILRNNLDSFIWSLRSMKDYERVEIPHITKKDLYITSGHWDKYSDELFKITTREGHEFAMKPMNCPHHTQIYARKPWSYRELPQRYANTTTCYRDEQTGELSGLSRVRAFAQDDAHVFCRMSQVKDEFLKIWDIVHTFYGSFGFELKLRISKHDPKNIEKYLGSKENWKLAESTLEEIAKEKGMPFIDGIGEAAFYGPKLDFLGKDAIGREWQLATIQLDMVQPERFDLTCVNEKGEKERIVMIHAAIMGSIERFLSIIIEHTAGNFPLWLSPVQVAVIPVSEDQITEANKVKDELRKHNIRVELNSSTDGFGKKVHQAKLDKIPYFIIIGDKDIKAGKVTLESRDKGQIGQIELDKVIEILNKEIAEKK